MSIYSIWINWVDSIIKVESICVNPDDLDIDDNIVDTIVDIFGIVVEYLTEVKDDVFPKVVIIVFDKKDVILLAIVEKSLFIDVKKIVELVLKEVFVKRVEFCVIIIETAEFWVFKRVEFILFELSFVPDE